MPDEIASPWRKQITELKLRVAHRFSFPFFVVGTEHFKDLSSSLQLTIVDGIIGEVLAVRTFRNWFQTRDFLGEMGITEEEFGVLSRSEQQDLVDRWGVGIEVSATLCENPVARLSSQLFDKIIRTSLLESVWKKHQRTGYMIGVECIIQLKQMTPIAKKVWLPDFDVPNFYVGSCCDEIAELLAADATVRFLEKLGLIPPR